MADIKPFKIDIPDDKLRRLKQRLELTEFPSELTNVGRRYGSALPEIKKFVEYWQNKFDWRAQEAKLNKLSQFTTAIDADGFGPLDIHFVHQRSGVDGAIPLLFVHGWPGSFIEVIKLLPLLQGGNGKPAFDVVAPSLPNFGFSGRVEKPGFTLSSYAEVLNKLMIKLGYNEYVTQGGDWGHWITSIIGQVYPQNCKGNHTNFPILMGINDPGKLEAQAKTELEKAMVERGKWFRQEGHGYLMEQGSRPMTLAYSLRDSPVGLLAWIYEKLVEWTDSYPWTEDEVLTWISIYLFSRAGPDASIFIYYEAMHDPTRRPGAARPPRTETPVALAYFPKELTAMPESIIKEEVNVQQISHYDHGGHFAAWEHPEELAGDVSKFYGKGGAAAGVVSGKTGY